MWYPGNCCRRWTSSFYAVSWWSPIISDFWVWLGRKKTPQHSEAHCTFTDFPPYLHVLNISSISSIPSFLNVALQEVSSFLSLWTESVKGGTLALQALSFKGWSDRIFILIYIYILYIYTGWWFGTWLLWLSHHIGNVIIPTDFHSIIFQRGSYTTNQYTYIYIQRRVG